MRTFIDAFNLRFEINKMPKPKKKITQKMKEQIKEFNKLFEEEQDNTFNFLLK